MHKPSPKVPHPYLWLALTLASAVVAPYLVPGLLPASVRHSSPLAIFLVPWLLWTFVASALTLVNFFPLKRQIPRALVTYFVVVTVALELFFLAMLWREFFAITGPKHSVQSWAGAFLTPVLIAMVATVGATFFLVLSSRNQEVGNMRCSACGYDLDGSRLAEHCPECGHDLRNGVDLPLNPELNRKSLELLSEGDPKQAWEKPPDGMDG